MVQAKTRHLFPGANTPQGFYSLFPHIADEGQTLYYYFIKGGPGTGKSTFMNKLAQGLQKTGYRVEYFHCSSDIQSLDAVFFPDAQVVMIDATAPHVYDPQYPGAGGRILEMGVFWDRDAIMQHREKIQRISAHNKTAFATAFRYLAAAKPLQEELHNQTLKAITPWAADKEANTYIKTLMNAYPVGQSRGKERRLFATGFTPDGLCSYLDSALTDYTRVYRITGPSGCSVILLKKLAEAALARGLDVETYFCPLNPGGSHEHLLIPSLDTAFITANEYHDTSRKNALHIDMASYIDNTHFDEKDANLTTKHMAALIHSALDFLSRSKEYHDELEACYAPYMNFEATNDLLEEIEQEILSLGKNF